MAREDLAPPQAAIGREHPVGEVKACGARTQWRTCA